MPFSSVRALLVVVVFLLGATEGFASKPNWKKLRRPFQSQFSKPSARDIRGPNSYRWVQIADHGDSEGRHKVTLSIIEKLHADRGIGALIVGGDNVYKKGEPEKFDALLGDAFGNLRNRGVKILPQLGNHDVILDGGRAQLRYWGLRQKRWYSFRLADGQVEGLAIDTTLHMPEDHPTDAAWQRTVKRQASRQHAWIMRRMAKSTAKYLVVVGHHPLYAGIGNFRTEERKTMRKLYQTALGKYRAIFLAGHVHDYERRIADQGFTHIIAGGAGYPPLESEWLAASIVPGATGPEKFPGNEYYYRNKGTVNWAKPGQGRGIQAWSGSEHNLVFWELKNDGLHFTTYGHDGKSPDSAHVVDEGVLPAKSR